MATPEPSQTNTTVPMIICPTTHNDWDWQQTFEDYYTTAWSGYGVQGILASVATILGSTTSPDTEFCFSYAEVGYLRQYLTDNPDSAAVLSAAGNRFCLLGGGITSPDNQACHGEVFIRNYLTGHEYLKSVGLLDNVFMVAWLPDDFGHDPQLPVLIEALGMNSIGLSRIPGSPQPTLCPSKQPANDYVRANGLSFYWSGSDGSKILTHFMPATYYGITSGLSNSDMQDTQGIQDGVQDFLDNNYDGVLWPGGTIFATEGGDWQFPVSSATGGTADGAYDWIDVNNVNISSSSGDVTAACRLGTFADYYNALMQTPGDIPAFTLYAENYWTGYFASRPQLKIDQYQSAQLLLGAEVLGSILTVYAGTPPQDRAQLLQAIAAGWNLLVPTTHHDFITGTSPDNVYQVPNAPSNPVWDSAGQLPMSSQTVTLATDAMNLAMSQLADTVAATPGTNETPVVVFNQTGRDLPDTALVEMADPSNGTNDFQVRVGADIGPVQRSSDGTLLFQVPGMRSMAYQVVYLVATGPATAPMQPQNVIGDYAFTNDNVVNLTLSQNTGWAITQLTIGDNSYIQPDGPYANRIGVWKDGGNLYQFGMEFMSDCGQGEFEFESFLTGAEGQLVEAGPIRWRFIGHLNHEGTRKPYTTQYDLIRGERLVRMTTTGAAPNISPGASVLTAFPMQTPAGETGGVLEYGTSYYWENRNPQQSWNGLTFRASRDFAQLATASGDAIAAVYHNGIPAWTIEGSVLLGCLLRNAPGTQRGASGIDLDTHTQTYTLDVETQPAVTGYPLRTALYTQTPLHAAVVSATTSAKMREAAQLASVNQPDAVLRVAKMNPPADDNGRNLILRVQQATTDTQQLDIHLPFLESGGLIVWPSIVTALETTPENPPKVSFSGTTASFQANRALWTMQVPITDPDTRIEKGPVAE